MKDQAPRISKRKQSNPRFLVSSLSQRQHRLALRTLQDTCVSCPVKLRPNHQSCHRCQKFVCNRCLTVWLQGLEVLPHPVGERFCTSCNEEIELLVAQEEARRNVDLIAVEQATI